MKLWGEWLLSYSISRKNWRTYHFLRWGRSYRLLLLSRFSRVWLCATPETTAHQPLLPLGFSRQEHWSGYRLASCKIIGQDWFSKREPLKWSPDRSATGWQCVWWGMAITTEAFFEHSTLSFSSLRRQEKKKYTKTREMNISDIPKTFWEKLMPIMIWR